MRYGKWYLFLWLLFSFMSEADRLKGTPSIIFNHHKEFLSVFSIPMPKTSDEYDELIRLADLGNTDANWMYAAIERNSGDKNIAKQRYILSIERRDIYHAKSMVNIGFLYNEEGQFFKARDLFELAGKEGNPNGYGTIATNYLHGTNGMNQNLNRAKWYFSKAAELGDNESKIIIEQWTAVIKIMKDINAHSK